MTQGFAHSDILSCYKEEQEEDTDNYVYARAEVTGKGVSDTLRDIINEWFAARARIRQMLPPGPPRAAWDGFESHPLPSIHTHSRGSTSHQGVLPLYPVLPPGSLSLNAQAPVPYNRASVSTTVISPLSCSIRFLALQRSGAPNPGEYRHSFVSRLLQDHLRIAADTRAVFVRMWARAFQAAGLR